MTFDLNEGHHQVKLAPAVLLTRFGIPRALFNVFDPRGPRGPRTPYPCKTFVATPLYMLLTKFGQNPIINVEGVANCQKERKKERRTRHDCALCKGTSEVRRKHLLKWRNREGHHYLKLALAILLTKFGNHSAKFTTFDLWWPLTFMKVITIINLHQGFFLTKFGNQSATFTTFNLWWPLTFMKVIIIINLHQGFFWLSLVAIAHTLPHLTSDDLWPPWRSSSL